MYFVFNISSSYLKDFLFFTFGKQMYEFNHENCINIEFDLSVDENREDLCDFKEAKANHKKNKKKETKDNDERNDDDTFLLLRFTKKRFLFFAKKKRRVKRCVKRYRFSSSFSLNEDTATKNESDISSYISFRLHRLTRLWFIFFHSIDFEKNTCDDDQIKTVNEQFSITVIYEQQS